MSKEELVIKGYKLTGKMFLLICEMVKDNKALNDEELFVIVNESIAGLISETTLMLFREDIPRERMLSYINEICNYSKERLSDYFKMKKDMQ